MDPGTLTCMDPRFTGTLNWYVLRTLSLPFVFLDFDVLLLGFVHIPGQVGSSQRLLDAFPIYTALSIPLLDWTRIIMSDGCLYS